jgi:hypothetical protein
MRSTLVSLKTKLKKLLRYDIVSVYCTYIITSTLNEEHFGLIENQAQKTVVV